MHHIIKIIPHNLARKAQTDSFEYAWNKINAVEVIEYISKHNLLVKQISIWVIVDSRIKKLSIPFHWTNPLPIDTGSWQQIVKNGNDVAKNYIASYYWDNVHLEKEYGEPYFKLSTIANKYDKIINYYLRSQFKFLLEDFSSLEKQKEVIVSDKQIFAPFEWAELFFSINESNFTEQEWDILRPYLESARSYFQDPKSRALDGKDHLKMLEYQPWIDLCELAKLTLDKLNAIGWDAIKARS